METPLSSPIDTVRIVFWRIIAAGTEFVLLRRAQVGALLPYAGVAAGAAAAYLVGRLIGEWLLLRLA